MRTNQAWIALAAATALTVSCNRKHAPKPISPEAAEAFGRAEVNGMGGSLVIDAEALRQLGSKPAAQGAGSGDVLLDLAVALLPAMAAELEDHPSAPILARTAVLLALVREWAIAPHAQRIGVVVQVNAARPAETANRSYVLLAVREGEEENRELLQGLGAAVRAAAGREVVTTEDGDLCVAPGAIPEVPVQVCLRAGPGLIVLGTSEALASLAAAPPAAAARESGPALRLLVNLPAQGRGELVVEGRGELHVSGVFEPEDPALADAVEQGARKLLELADQRREKSRTVMARALEEVQGSIASDPGAPDRMRSAVADAELERLLDPRGEYAAFRASVRIAREGNVVTAGLTIPEGQVRRFLQTDPSALTSVAVVGIVSAIAVPNFIRYQCRSRTAEGPAAIEAIRRASEAYRVAHGSTPPSLDLVRYTPAAGSRYTVCATPGGCVSPAAARGEASCREALAQLAEEEGGAVGFCAAAEIEGKMDVWVAGASGPPRAVRSACE